MAHVTRKLRTPLQGALAGGGDPATSPLYVFGPFLRLIVAAGVAKVTFGASIWLVVLTIAVVSAMYRLVMRWVTDGSGGSGLSEEEFGAWAVKTNAGITFVEYTLTFLVSVAALVTFVADRFPRLNETDALVSNRTWLAIGVSLLTGWLVNRGPSTTARTFGPATGGVLVLLWAMMVATVIKTGFHLPSLDLRAFTPTYWDDTFGGYARILAVMTGIEIFANMVAAYDGPAEQRSRKAFQGLLIIMGTTAMTMLVVGPAILRTADPFDRDVSVFTQTMDRLLPGPLSEAGTVVGVAVLLSAAAASALGLQNLFVGLRLRHFVPPPLGRLNRFGVADRPVWIEVGVASTAFLAFGTEEETYLALYAAGVFVLLGMTGWAATKRLAREQRLEPSTSRLFLLAGAATAAALTTGATIIIFTERFTEGAWTYFVFIPVLYLVFGYFRRSLGPPSVVAEQAGARLSGSMLKDADTTIWEIEADHGLRRALAPVDGSRHAAEAVPLAVALTDTLGAELQCVVVGPDDVSPLGVQVPLERVESSGSVAETLCALVDQRSIDLVVMSTRGHTGLRRAVLGSVTAGVVHGAHRPVLVLPPRAASGGPSWRPSKLMVALDGSLVSERSLLYAQQIARASGAELILAHTTDQDGAAADPVRRHLEQIRRTTTAHGVRTSIVVGGGEPGAAIPMLAATTSADMIVMTTHGRGGLERVVIGSVADTVVRTASMPVLLIPILELRTRARATPITGS